MKRALDTTIWWLKEQVATRIIIVIAAIAILCMGLYSPELCLRQLKKAGRGL